jgi:hypothetical protein
MFLGSKVRPVFRADSLTAICEPIVYPCYEDSFTFFRKKKRGDDEFFPEVPVLDLL